MKNKTIKVKVINTFKYANIDNFSKITQSDFYNKNSNPHIRMEYSEYILIHKKEFLSVKSDGLYRYVITEGTCKDCRILKRNCIEISKIINNL